MARYSFALLGILLLAVGSYVLFFGNVATEMEVLPTGFGSLLLRNPDYFSGGFPCYVGEGRKNISYYLDLKTLSGQQSGSISVRVFDGSWVTLIATDTFTYPATLVQRTITADNLKAGSYVLVVNDVSGQAVLWQYFSVSTSIPASQYALMASGGGNILGGVFLLILGLATKKH